jgi:hypothetical protein
MKDISESQQQMREAKIRESPIFQAFMGVMSKIGEVGGKAAGAVEGKIADVKETIDSKRQAKEGLAQTQGAIAQHLASTSDGDGAPKKPGSLPKKNMAFDAVKDPKVKQAEDTLSRLAAQDDTAPDLEEVDATLLEDGDEAASPEDLAVVRNMKANPARIEGREVADRERANTEKQRAMIDKLESEGKFSSKEYGAPEPAESGVRRTNVEGADRDKKTESPIARKKRIAEEQAQKRGGVAKSLRRRRVVPMHEIVKSDAWSIALDLGMQAKSELRKSYAGPRLVIITKAAPRVPYFFNEL